MHDLRYDQEAADAATHAKLRPVTGVREPSTTVPTYSARVISVESLRTVPMPELRSPDARTLDERMDAELTALRLSVQELRQAVGDLQRMVMEVRNG